MRYAKNIFHDIESYILSKRLQKRSKQFLECQHDNLAVFALDYITINLLIHGVYEKNELIVLEKWLRSMGRPLHEMRVVDVGANIGNHTVYFSKNARHVVGFEPCAQTFELLRFNTRNLGNVEIRQKGLSSAHGTGNIMTPRENVGGAALVGTSGCNKGSEEVAQGELVELSTLDSEFSTEKIGLIKIDVEGHELEVLKGAARVLSESKPTVLFEHRGKIIDSPVVKFLNDFGYRKFLIPTKHIRGHELRRLPKFVRPFARRWSMISLPSEWEGEAPFVVAAPPR